MTGLVQFGDVVVTVWANEVAEELDQLDAFMTDINAAVAAAEAAAEAAEAAAELGGGLPIGTDLDDIPDGQSRFALPAVKVSKLDGIADQATRLLLGTSSTTAKAGNWVPSILDVPTLAAELAVRELIIRWDSTSRAWPPRPAAYGFGALFLSTNDPTAPAPPASGLLVGDVWRRHPNAG